MADEEQEFRIALEEITNKTTELCRPLSESMVISDGSAASSKRIDEGLCDICPVVIVNAEDGGAACLQPVLSIFRHADGLLEVGGKHSEDPRACAHEFVVGRSRRH